MKRTFSKEDWKGVEGASSKAKRLKLVANSKGLFVCPVLNCDSDSYHSQRGCRKHVATKHGWYYYFESKPNVDELFPEKILASKRPVLRSKTWDMPTFSDKCKLAHDFISWICSAGGGGKDRNQAQQLCRKILKFCKFILENMSEDFELTQTLLEFCLGSTEFVSRFLKFLEDDCKVGKPGMISYLHSLSHGLDFLRYKGIRADKITIFLSTEVFLSRAKQCLRRKMRVEWNTLLSIEHLESINCWASLADLQKVIPYHEIKYKQVVNLAQINAHIAHDLSFASSFVISLLFLKVKGSRPMTFQFLTVKMLSSAMETGMIDQTHFKTEEQYAFDSLVFSEQVLLHLKNYVDHVRPRLNPNCDFLLVCRNGNQLKNLGDIFGRMVYQAIGKYVTPTRYRQIIETASAEHLSPEEQAVISLDQKHTSNVAKVHYQKRKSQDIAKKADQCMAKLIQNAKENEEHVEVTVSEKRNPERQDLEIEEPIKEQESIEIKTVEKKTRNKKHAFTEQEDNFLSNGIKKHGLGKWSTILKDPQYKFHPSRKNSTLMMRAKAKKFI